MRGRSIRTGSLDNALPGRVAELLQLPSFKPAVTLADGTRHELVLEGGSIDTNGDGVLLTTEECLLSTVQQRNPGVSREQLEQAFHDYLGIDQVLWMNRGIAGDDTHGHVDDITRFVDRNTIVTVVEANRADENHEPLAENLDRLRAARNRDGQPFRIVELPLPSPVVFRRATAAGELCKLLYRKWPGAGPYLQRRERSPCAEHAGRVVSAPSHRGHPLRGFHLGTRRPALHDAAAAGGLMR